MGSSLSGPCSAAVIGAACGARTFAGPGVLALRGWPGSGWVRGGILALAAAELVVDKLPVAGSRSRPGPLAARAVSGAIAGMAVDGARGAWIGGLAGLAAAHPLERARASAGKRGGLPDPVVAVAEDSLAYGSAWLASGAAEQGGRG